MTVTSRTGVTIAVSLGTASVPMDTAVNVAFPYITGDLGVAPDAIRWVVVSYVLTYASLLLVAGRLADRFGHRRMFMGGMLINLLGLSGCAMAGDLSQLVAARMVQGVGAAGILAAGPALITLARPSAERLGALGSYTLAFGIAGALGPLAGGAVLPVLEWHGVFWFRLPVVLAGLAMTVLFITPGEAPKPDDPRRVDVGAVTGVVLTLVCGLLAIGQLPREGIGSVTVVGMAAIAVVGIGLYVWRVRQNAGRALFAGSLLADTRFVMLNLAHGLTALAEFTIMLLVPFYLAASTGLATLSAGVVMASAPAGIVIASAAIRRHAGRTLPRALPPVAVVVLAIGLASIGEWPRLPATAHMMATLMLAGAGYGVYHVTAMDRVMGSLSERERGVAGSISMLVRTAGVVCGASLGSWWFVTRGGNDPETFQSAFRASFHAAAVLALAASVLAWLAARARPASDAAAPSD